METKFNTIYTCPFCAYNGELRLYSVYGKKGYKKNVFKCPDCGQIMRKETLTREISVKEWASWLYSSIRIFNDHRHPELSFYNRISWEKLSTRLKFYGLASEFWDSWKETKELSRETLEKIVYEQSIKKKKTQTKLQ